MRGLRGLRDRVWCRYCNSQQQELATVFGQPRQQPMLQIMAGQSYQPMQEMTGQQPMQMAGQQPMQMTGQQPMQMAVQFYPQMQMAGQGYHQPMQMYYVQPGEPTPGSTTPTSTASSGQRTPIGVMAGQQQLVQVPPQQQPVQQMACQGYQPVQTYFYAQEAGQQQEIIVPPRLLCDMGQDKEQQDHAAAPQIPGHPYSVEGARYGSEYNFELGNPQG